MTGCQRRLTMTIYAAAPGRTAVIVSISGRNAGVVDMALAAKKIGMKVIALSSKQFANSTTSRHSSGRHLTDVADVVIDIKCVSGDAALSIDGLEPRFCGTSTVLGMSVMESIIAQTVENCAKAGYYPPIYVSSNLDKGDAINKEYIKNTVKLFHVSEKNGFRRRKSGYCGTGESAAGKKEGVCISYVYVDLEWAPALF